jgi:transaldolase
VKFFIDTANIGEIREAATLGLLDGASTSPDLVAREGKELQSVLREIVSIVNGPVAAEVTASESDEMLDQGRELAAIHPNIVVKLPLTREGLRACKMLRSLGSQVDLTGCLGASHALLAAKAGASYISPSHEGLQLIRQIRTIYDNYGFETEILAASIGSPAQCVEAALAGADAAGISFRVVMQLLEHPRSDNALASSRRD